MMEIRSGGATEALRRQRFQLGELRREFLRERQLREAIASDQGLGRCPDYVGIGVQRAGTSRWHNLLTEHPDVAEVVDSMGRVVKEIHWFDRPMANDVDLRARAYKTWFRAPEDKVIGEFTPRYLYDLWPLAHMREVCPDTKLIVLLREPNSRLVSALQFYEQRGISLDRDSLRESIWRGQYGRQLEFVLNSWPKEQVFISLYEDCCLRPRDELKKLYEFLDLDSSFIPPGLDRRVNSSVPIDISPAILDSARELYEADAETLRLVIPDVDFSSWGD